MWSGFYVDAMDVTKQADMTGFYRNLYKQTVGTGPDDVGVVKKESNPVKAEPASPTTPEATNTSEVQVKNEFKRKSPSKR